MDIRVHTFINNTKINPCELLNVLTRVCTYIDIAQKNSHYIYTKITVMILSVYVDNFRIKLQIEHLVVWLILHKL